MKVIRDNELNGIMMIPLWEKFNLHKCNVRNCNEKQTTIIIELIDTPFALCEKHFMEAKKNEKINCILDF